MAVVLIGLQAMFVALSTIWDVTLVELIYHIFLAGQVIVILCPPSLFILDQQVRFRATHRAHIETMILAFVFDLSEFYTGQTRRECVKSFETETVSVFALCPLYL